MAQTQEVTCDSCSTTLRVPDKYWGKKIRCPQCKEAIAVPSGSAAAVATAKAPATDDVDFLDDDAFVDEDPYVDSSSSSSAAPRIGTSTKSSRPDPKKAGGGAFGMEKKMFGSGVLGGIGLMLGAVVWFVLGLMADRIFFYPPIMFIIGFVAMIKGIIGSR
jgi:hypothetical protein